jgi:hypothetical protein
VERILVAERASMIPFVLGATVAIFLSSLLLALFRGDAVEGDARTGRLVEAIRGAPER